MNVDNKLINFKPFKSLTKITISFLYFNIALAVVAIILNFLEYQLLSDIKMDNFKSESILIQSAEINDDRMFVMGIIQIAAFIISGFCILKWIYRANYNAHQLSSSKMDYSSGWSIGWYFIPFANLWKPFGAMKEIWQVSDKPESWTNNDSVSSLLGLWWFLWIVSNFLGRVVFRLARDAEEIDEFLRLNIFMQVSDGLEIPLNLVLLLIIKSIHEKQTAYATKDEISPKTIVIDTHSSR